MALTNAQADLRRAHVNGGAGVMVSGLAWLATAIALVVMGLRPGFFALFISGLAISPVAQMATRFIFKAPPSDAGKRFEWIAIATVPILLAGFYIAWLRLEVQPLSAIPIVAIGVGLRYLTFPVMFGGRSFLFLGSAFILAGAAGVTGIVASPLPITLGLALLELAVGFLLWRQWRAAQSTWRKSATR